KVVDTTVVVMTPNSGDVLQIFKAGIMEIADLFVINKADLPGFGKLKALLKELVMISATDGYQTAIVKTIATENKGIDKLWQAIEDSRTHLDSTAPSQSQPQQRKVQEVLERIREESWFDVRAFINSRDDVIIEATSDPYQLAKDWLEKWRREGGPHR